MIYRFIFICCFFSVFFSQIKAQVSFYPNRGQWDSRILYKVPVADGKVLINNSGLIFDLNNIKSTHNHHDDNQSESINHHIVSSQFLNSTWKGKIEESEQTNFYSNYILGNDKSKWKSKIYNKNKLKFIDFYQGVDLIYQSSEDDISFNFEVSDFENLNQIKFKIEGANSIYLKYKELFIETVFGEIIYSEPKAWQFINDKKVDIIIDYKLDRSNTVGFEFKSQIDKNHKLYIDPNISFSTFTGSTSDNWGMTATPDNLGNLYAAGIVFDNGGSYPVTTGVFDTTFNGGEVYQPQPYYGFDIAISKFNVDGTELLYATYLGGNGNETPHSLVVDDSNNLYIMGATSSVDFPSHSDSYDNTFNGGNTALNNNLYFSASDIYITKLSSDGSQLLGMTFMGGSGNDGLSNGDLEYNYGDAFRGEIIYGKDKNIYVTSSTSSFDFPILSPFQSSMKGQQDAVVFALDEDLTQLKWSSYFGGGQEETGNSIQQSSGFEIYVAGGTNSSDIGGGMSYNGGESDGYLLRINAVNGNLINQRLVGGTDYDQAYFVQIDTDDKVYVYGQSKSNLILTNGVYGTPNSGQFIQKLSKDLGTIEWQTKIGSGSGDIEISPTAFLVSDCNEIYIAGWGGAVNVYHGKALNSSTNNFPVTSDAFQSVTNGSNFYIAVYAPDMDSLTYATFMGGTVSSSCHVDGGTSRFDKNGNIYHAVCAACGGNSSGFTTTPGVYSETNQSSNCNLAAFKFELNQVYAEIDFMTPSLCVNNNEVFYAVNSNANYFFWDFGDGITSNLQNPSHTYQNSGVYSVQLAIGSSANCLIGNTIVREVEVLGDDFSVGPLTNPYCIGDEVILSAFGGQTYEWIPNSNFNDFSDSSTLVKVTGDELIKVVIQNDCFTDTFNLNIEISNDKPYVSNDTLICLGEEVDLNVSNMFSIDWDGETYITSNFTQNLIPSQSSSYDFTIQSNDGCLIDTSFTVQVVSQAVDSYIPDSLKVNSICLGSQFQLDIENTISQVWSPAQTLSSSTQKNPIASPNSDITYYVSGVSIEGCPYSDSIFLKVYDGIPNSNMADTILSCLNSDMLVQLNSSNASSFNYFFTPNTTSVLIDSNVVSFLLSDTFQLESIFQNVCGQINKITTFLPLVPDLEVSPDTLVCEGNQIKIGAKGAANYNWYFENQTFIQNSDSIIVNASLTDTLYYVVGEDDFNCKDTLSVEVKTFKLPLVNAMEDYLAEKDELIELSALSNSIGTYNWFYNGELICQDCQYHYVIAEKASDYIVEFVDTNGCRSEDQVKIFFDAVLFIPNSFTPSEKDMYNNFFTVKGYNIVEFEIFIFSRWGNLVFYSNEIDNSWDGNFNSEPCQVGTYAWKINYTDISGNSGEKIGHVNLIR